MPDIQTPTQFPQYPTPVQASGTPVAHPQQAKILMKAIKTVAKLSRRMPTRGRKSRGLTAPDTVHIRRRKQKFY